MKLYINRSQINGPWGGGAHFINAFHQYVPQLDHELCGNGMSDVPDAIMIAGLDSCGGISAEQAIMYKVYQDRVKLFLRVNENDARKGTDYMDQFLLKIASHVDGTVFVSKWLYDYFIEKKWPCLNNVVIVNGVHHEIFKPTQKLNNGKINIVMSHWSDNPMKGQDFAEWLDEFVKNHNNEYSFTFVGRTQAKLKNSTHIQPLFGKKLADELAKYDVCINASRFDPGPNSVIEPITCGVPTYVHIDGGGAVEFAGKDHVFSSCEELRSILERKEFKQNTTSFKPWKDTIESYIKFIKQSI